MTHALLWQCDSEHGKVGDKQTQRYLSSLKLVKTFMLLAKTYEQYSELSYWPDY